MLISVRIGTRGYSTTVFGDAGRVSASSEDSGESSGAFGALSDGGEDRDSSSTHAPGLRCLPAALPGPLLVMPLMVLRGKWVGWWVVFWWSGLRLE